MAVALAIRQNRSRDAGKLPHMTSPLSEGLHEALLTRELQGVLSRETTLLADLGKVDPEDQVHVLARHVASAAMQRLANVHDPVKRLELANDFLTHIADESQLVIDPVEQLEALRPPLQPGTLLRYSERPRTPLNDAALLTNAHGEPSLASELRAELDSADSVDLLCAFVMWHGLRLLERPLATLKAAGVPLRVITTTYIGGTERRALDRLVQEFGADVRIQYDAARTRLHAKAWIFRRNTGYDTAYVGSSNLTTSAMLEGVEWNVRLSNAATPTLMRKFQATFDSYWNSGDFETYDPERDAERLDQALALARGGKRGDRLLVSLSGLEVRPLKHQQEILEMLQAEREIHDRRRNLVVAATGTGKTVVAALDYRRLAEQARRRPSLLFVAHRKEILQQSRRMYQEVLRDASFGELYVGSARPEQWRHVFASVQSLTSYGVERIAPDAFDIVVIDEFHHAEARTYRRILDHLDPRELLGLTATPERADGLDVRHFFDGRTAAELRLWDALGSDLLCPFHYFAVADGTDLRSIAWTRGRYDEGELEGVYTGNDARSRIVLSQLRDKISDVSAMRALGFCVGVAHAEYMTRVFNEAGIPAKVVTGATPPHEREQALRELRDATVNVLFTVDVFNEGLDIPDVDTLLMLRPTESATIFMQQLGRGLRRTREKAVLTVLDFVGLHRTEFRFAERYRALTGIAGRHLTHQVEKGFPFLPSGCQIVMDKQAQASILDNLRGQISTRWAKVVAELRRSPTDDLSGFLDRSGLELSDVLRRGSHSWTQLRRDAELQTAPGSVLEDKLLKRVRAFAHVDDDLRADTYRALLSDDAPPYSQLSPVQQKLARMLRYSFWNDGGGHTTTADALESLRPEEATRAEVRAVIDISFDAARHVTTPLLGDLGEIPLRIHARYQREEILAALDFPRLPNSFREGVWYSADHNVDAFFITLKKSEADYSPTTMYADYPVSPELFHWESQSTTSVGSPTGQRYLNGTSTVLLFVRHEQKDDFGTSPYLFLGPATYVSHAGDRPIAVTWKLDTPMPSDFFNLTSAVAP